MTRSLLGRWRLAECPKLLDVDKRQLVKPLPLVHQNHLWHLIGERKNSTARRKVLWLVDGSYPLTAVPIGFYATLTVNGMEITCSVSSIVVRQPLGKIHGQCRLHFDIEAAAHSIYGEYIQYNQFILRTVLAMNRIQDLDFGNRLRRIQHSVQKVDRHTRMVGTAEHQLESEINFGIDTKRHNQPPAANECVTAAVDRLPIAPATNP
jgi:hypothetical protein